MNREEKTTLVANMKEALTASDFVVLLHYRGMSDKELYDFRVELKSKNVKLKIAKNTLVKVAIKDTDLEILEPHLKGPTAIAYANDAASLAKVVCNTAKDNKFLDIQIGYMNKSVLTKEAIGSLSKLGSLEEVRASFIAKLKGAQSGFVGVLNAPGSKTVSLLNNYSASKE